MSRNSTRNRELLSEIRANDAVSFAHAVTATDAALRQMAVNLRADLAMADKRYGELLASHARADDQLERMLSDLETARAELHNALADRDVARALAS